MVVSDEEGVMPRKGEETTTFDAFHPANWAVELREVISTAETLDWNWRLVMATPEVMTVPPL